jgi:quercetin dioxygenase-like cupin family protein
MKNIESEKSKILIVVELIEYIANSVVIKTILKKTTGNLSVVSFGTGEFMSEKISPFDSFIQIIDGNAEVVIEDKPFLLNTGESIIIPAHARSSMKADHQFKMISTVITSGHA